MNMQKLFSRKSQPKNSPKVFCISMQRSGTSSVGQFFKDHVLGGLVGLLTVIITGHDQFMRAI